MEALQLLVQRLGRATARSVLLKDAPGSYLAQAVEVKAPGEAATTLVAGSNVWALPPQARKGDVCSVLGVVTPAGVLPAPVTPAPDRLGVWRVESGAPAPPGHDRALALQYTSVVGSGLVRLDDLETLCDWQRSPVRWSFPAGTPLDERVRATLAVAGVSEVAVLEPATVALVLLGDELGPPGSGQPREDRTGPWLGPAIKALGHGLIDLGLRPESSASVRDAILHCRGRADVLVLVGGLGDGLTDRTIEHVERFDARFTFHGVTCDGASRLFHARTLGMDIVGLGGKPLEAASGFDLFLAPALLARQGAPRSDWDWSPGSLTADPGLLAEAPATWIARPARLEPLEGGGGWQVRLTPSAPATSQHVWNSHPVAPGQQGWALLSPAGADGHRRVFFQRLPDGRKVLQ